MMLQKRIGISSYKNLDFLAMGVSGLCAIHCSLLPILLGAGLLGSAAWMDHFWVEVVFLSSSLILASASLVNSYIKYHRNIRPFAIATLGFMIFIIGLQNHGTPEIVCTTIAGLLIGGAHLLNWRLRK